MESNAAGMIGNFGQGDMGLLITARTVGMTFGHSILLKIGAYERKLNSTFSAMSTELVGRSEGSGVSRLFMK
jgi:hypothetical protein